MFSLEQEPKTRVKDPRFWDLIHHPYVRVKKKDDAIEDVYDGTLYPENLALGDFTTLGSTDGFRLFSFLRFNSPTLLQCRSAHDQCHEPLPLWLVLLLLFLRL